MNTTLSLTTFTAFCQGVVNIQGAGFLLLLLITNYSYFSYPILNKFTKAGVFILLTILVVGLIFHKLPGFFNALVVNRLQVSDSSSPFMMYLNFDKVMTALILYTTSPLGETEKPINKRFIIQSIFTIICCVIILLVAGFLLSYIKFDPKIPSIIGIWSLNNLLFVCVAEEIIFRGFLQERLKSLVAEKLYLRYLPIGISGALYGLSQFNGGISYIILVSMAGFFMAISTRKATFYVQ